MTNAKLNQAILRIARRAESNDAKTLVETFVTIGPLIPALQSPDHQVIFGRRGTGKTHVLRYLQSRLESLGEIALYVDLRTVGSNGGVYSDSGIPLPERGTRLLVDVLEAIHMALFEDAFRRSDSDERFAGGSLMQALDAVAEAISEVHLTGPSEISRTRTSSSESSNKDEAAVTLSPSPGVTLSGSSAATHGRQESWSHRVSGQAACHLHFGRLGRALQELINQFPKRRMWILLDEWSAVPMELQPYLADLIRRSILPSVGAVVKIAAIEARTNFMTSKTQGEYLGIELGADAATSVNLDDFMVFGNDPARAQAFFADLFHRHIATDNDTSVALRVSSGAKFVAEVFTQRNAFTELVRASEGVPRDAINVLAQAALKADDVSISVPMIREAAANWYARDKERAIEINHDARALLNWIRDEVIGHRKTRAFLLEQGPSANHPLIQYLHDSRLLHVLRRSVAGGDMPGIRFNMYGLDYGCYVNLINTHNEPRGLFLDEDDTYVQVPLDDLRSVRRAILDLAAFDKVNSRVNPILRRRGS